MLVTFSSPAYADIMMFGGIATRLLKLMGHSGTIPSALTAEDVQPALERLVVAIEKGKSLEPDNTMDDGQDDEPVVNLSQRAVPLIELLKAAARAKCDVMWDSNE